MTSPRRIMKGARYSFVIVETICFKLTQGESLREILAEKGMPTYATFCEWLLKYEQVKEMYEQAMIIQADYLADQQLELARKVLLNPKNAAAYKVAADILMKQAQVRAPRKYSDRSTVDLNKTEIAQTPEKIQAEIKRLQEELGVGASMPMVKH